jgi:hypothetical protein
MNLPQIPADKANHALYGAAIFVVAGWLATHLGFVPYARLIGAATAALFGALKELADDHANERATAAGLPPPHEVSASDAFTTTGGAMLCWVGAVATGD